MNIYARGGLGNQILQFFLGIAYAESKKQDWHPIFSSKLPPKSSNIFHLQETPIISDLFEFNKNIEIQNNTYDKLCYWHTGYIDLYFQYRKQLLGNIIKPKYNFKSDQKYTVVHIRGRDKSQSQVLELYRPLIYDALSCELPIKIVTDDQQLSSYLANHFALKYDPVASGVIEDWLTVLFASNVFSIYSTFPYSTLLIDPLKNYIINYGEKTNEADGTKVVISELFSIIHCP